MSHGVTSLPLVERGGSVVLGDHDVKRKRFYLVTGVLPLLVYRLRHLQWLVAHPQTLHYLTSFMLLWLALPLIPCLLWTPTLHNFFKHYFFVFLYINGFISFRGSRRELFPHVRVKSIFRLLHNTNNYNGLTDPCSCMD